MGLNKTKPIDEDLILQLTNETGFKAKEIQKLFSRFKKLDEDRKGYLSRADFLRIAELTINPIGDRIVHCFFKESKSEQVNFRHFLRVLARFRPMDTSSTSLSSKEEKLKFVFSLYDLDDNDSISSEELLDILMSMTCGSLPENEVRGIVQQSISEADTDCDNQIGFKEFYKVMKDEQVAEKMCIKLWQ